MPEQKHRILVIEDDEDITKIYGRFLSRLDCEVKFAATGAAAIEIAVEFCPDLAFVDTMLPDMLGTSVIDQLRDDPRTACCRIIVVSGLDPAFGDSSADATLCKPFTGKDIASAVQKLEVEWASQPQQGG